MTLILTSYDYKEAIARIETLMSAAEGTLAADELEVLSILIEKYEQEHYPIPDAPACEVLRLYMDDHGLKDKDMVPYLGSTSTVSKVLNRKKELTLEQVRILSKELGIPVAALIGGNLEPNTEIDWTAFPLNNETIVRGKYGVV